MDLGSLLAKPLWFNNGSQILNPFLNEINIAVWVRIIGLPLRYYTNFTMRKIGKLLGTVVKVDKLNLAQSRGQFGRICVEIDLPHVEVEDNVYSVVHEGIFMICFNCGCFGHVKACCLYQKKDTPATDEGFSGNTNVDVTPNGKSDASHVAMDTCVSASTPNLDKPSSGRHGPWMLISYKSKKRVYAK